MGDRQIGTRSFLLLVGAHFLQALGFSSMLLIPRYLELLGGSRTEIGTIMGVAAISGLAVRPVVGWALDTLGRKRTLFFGTFMLVVGMTSFYFVRDVGFLVYADRLLMGIGTGTLFTGYFALASDIIPESRRTQGLSIFGISGLLPLFINPLAGQVINPMDIRWFLPVVGLVISLSFVPLALIEEPPQIRSGKLELRRVIHALRARPLWSVWIASMAFAALISMFMAFATVTASNRGVSSPENLWMAYAISAVLVRLFAGGLPDRLGHSLLIALALISYGAGTTVVAFSSSQTGFLVAGLFAGLGHGFGFPIMASQVATRVPDHLRGSGMAMFTSLWEVSSLLFTPCFGLIADRFDDATMFLAASVCSAVFLVIWWPVERAKTPI